MNTALQSTALAGALLMLAACQSQNSNTVYCADKPIGSEFIHNNMTYLVVGDARIRMSQYLDRLSRGDLRFCTSHVTNMNRLFAGEYAFNQPIGDWDVSNVTNMHSMFKGTDLFNQPIGDWDVSNVTNMESMFEEARNFNQPIEHWDTRNVKTMKNMFRWAYDFKQNLDTWPAKPRMEWEYE